MIIKCLFLWFLRCFGKTQKNRNAGPEAGGKNIRGKAAGGFGWSAGWSCGLKTTSGTPLFQSAFKQQERYPFGRAH